MQSFSYIGHGCLRAGAAPTIIESALGGLHVSSTFSPEPCEREHRGCSARITASSGEPSPVKGDDSTENLANASKEKLSFHSALPMYAGLDTSLGDKVDDDG